jgi:hypothetical protein
VTGRLFWIVLGAGAVLVWWHWDEIKAVYENRRAISAGARAVGAAEDLWDAGKDLWNQVTE